MKISKSTKQISLTALITSLTIFTCNLFTGGPSYTFNSGEVEWDDATRRMTEYRKSNQAMKVKYEVKDDTKKEVLKGLVFEAKHIRDLLDEKNELGKLPDTLILYFGRDGSFFDFPKWHANMHIYAVAVEDGKILTKEVYNKVDPCPPNCPEDQ